MSVYRIAGLNIAYAPQTDYAAAFLADYATSQNASVTLIVTPAMTEAESAFLPDAPKGVCEIAAILRELARIMPTSDRLLLHAATVVFDGAAYAFIAPSGTGKTTHVQLWEQRYPDRAYILNGDKLFIHISDDGITAHGNPWRGKEHLGRVGSAPLGGIVILSRSDDALCKPITCTEALPCLVRATALPKSHDERLCVLTLLEQLTTRTPLYHLLAPHSADAAEAVISAIGGTV